MPSTQPKAQKTQKTFKVVAHANCVAPTLWETLALEQALPLWDVLGTFTHTNRLSRRTRFEQHRTKAKCARPQLWFDCYLIVQRLGHRHQVKSSTLTGRTGRENSGWWLVVASGHDMCG